MAMSQDFKQYSDQQIAASLIKQIDAVKLRASLPTKTSISTSPDPASLSLQLHSEVHGGYPNQIGKDSDLAVIPSQTIPDRANLVTFGQPILFGRTETPEITADILVPWLKDYVNAVAEQTQTAVGTVIMLELSILAAALQKKFAVCPYGDDYVEPLNIWTLISLPSSVHKTEVFNALLKPVITWEKAEVLRRKYIVEEVEIVRDVLSKEVGSYKRLAAKADIRAFIEDKEPKESKESNDFIHKVVMINNNGMPKTVLLPPKIFHTDITEKNLIEELSENYERIALITDNANMLKLLATPVFALGYAGGTFKVKLNKKYAYLNNIATTVGLVISPQALSEFRATNKQRCFDVELSSKILFYLAQSNIGKRNLRARNSIAPEIKEAYENGINAMLSIYPTTTGNFTDSPILLKLSEEALELWIQFSEWLERELGASGELEDLQDWIGKLPGQALRIAGLCHIARLINPGPETSSALSALSRQNINLVMSNETIEPVLELCRKLIGHAKAAYDLLEHNVDDADAKYALKWLLANAEVNQNGLVFIRQNALHRSSRFKNSKLERVTNALTILRRRDMVSQQFTLPTAKPTYIYLINPALFKESVPNGQPAIAANQRQYLSSRVNRGISYGT